MFLKILYLYTIRYVIPLLPHAYLMRLAHLTGWLSARGRNASVIRQEMRRMLGSGKEERDLNRLTLQTQQDFHKDLFEIWSFPRLSKKKMERMTYMTGKENIEKALQKGRGVMIGVAHFGSWKIIIPALSYAGYPVHQIAISPLEFTSEDASFFQKKMMEIEYACEQSLDARFIYLGTFMREVYRAFQNNEVVINSFDGFRKKETVEVNLLHTQVPIDLSPIRLALRLRTPLLPAFAVRQKDNRHRIIIYDDILSDISDQSDRSVKEALERYLRIFETHITEKPSHYGRILFELATKYYFRASI
jgi:Kdo2-lipid IVA lauroyltransferase/acyltransferase